jgi:hypothetical protein
MPLVGIFPDFADGVAVFSVVGTVIPKNPETIAIVGAKARGKIPPRYVFDLSQLSASQAVCPSEHREHIGPNYKAFNLSLSAYMLMISLRTISMSPVGRCGSRAGDSTPASICSHQLTTSISDPRSDGFITVLASII